MDTVSKAVYSYRVTKHQDGSTTTVSDPVSNVVERQANTYDIYTSARELYEDIEAKMLVEQISASVVARLNPESEESSRKRRLEGALISRKLGNLTD